jgi:hypothetical protein
LKKRTKLRLFFVFLIIGFIISPAFADDTTINLDPTTPFVDIPVTVIEPVDAVISTTTGLSNTGTWIDSWIELWQNTTRIAFNDDGNHSAYNVLASIISVPLTAGDYFIRATSWNFIASNQTQSPTGSYLLSTNLVVTSPTPTPTETVTPSPEPTETITPTPEPTQPLNTPEPASEPISSVVIPDVEPTPIPQEITIPELEPVEQIIVEEPIETPIVEPVLSVEQIQELVDAEYITENTIQLEIPTALAEIPGIAEVFAATEAILNVGSDMTQEQREESQSVVVSALVLTQVASMANVSAGSSRTRRIKK